MPVSNVCRIKAFCTLLWIVLRVRACKSGETECMGSVMRICSEDGYWMETECPESTSCSKSGGSISCSMKPKRASEDDFLGTLGRSKTRRIQTSGDDEMDSNYSDASDGTDEPVRRSKQRAGTRTVTVTRPKQKSGKDAHKTTDRDASKQSTVTITKIPNEINLEFSTSPSQGSNPFVYSVIVTSPQSAQSSRGQGAQSVPSSTSGSPGGPAQQAGIPIPTPQPSPSQSTPSQPGSSPTPQPSPSQSTPSQGSSPAPQPSSSQSSSQGGAQPGPTPQPSPSQSTPSQSGSTPTPQPSPSQSSPPQGSSPAPQPSPSQSSPPQSGSTPTPQSSPSQSPSQSGSQQKSGEQSSSSAQQSSTGQSDSKDKSSSSSGGQIVTAAQLSSAMKTQGFSPNQTYLEAVVKGTNGHFKDKEMAAMFLAQLAHESGGFIHIEEIACKSTGCPGQYGTGAPGKSYHGRGFIQLSWPDNYKNASKDLGMGDKLYQTPEMVAQDPKLAMDVSVWYWDKRVATAPGVSEKKQFGLTTKAINGELECKNNANIDKSEKRYQLYKAIAKEMGVTNLASEGGCYSN